MAFKRVIESFFKPKENFTSRELNPGLLRESLTTLPLDHKGSIEKIEKKFEYFWQIFPAAVAGVASQDRRWSTILLEKFLFVFWNFYLIKFQNIFTKLSKSYAWLDCASSATMFDINLDTKNYSNAQSSNRFTNYNKNKEIGIRI